MHVSQVMHTEVIKICPEATAREAAESMKKHNVGLLPVLDQGETIGVLTDRDLALRVVAEGRDPQNVRVRDIMTRALDTVSDYQSVEDAVEMMRRKKLHRMLVLDRDNYVVGIVSLSDLAACPAERSVAGEVLDEVAHHRSAPR